MEDNHEPLDHRRTDPTVIGGRRCTRLNQSGKWFRLAGGIDRTTYRRQAVIVHNQAIMLGGRHMADGTRRNHFPRGLTRGRFAGPRGANVVGSNERTEGIGLREKLRNMANTLLEVDLRT